MNRNFPADDPRSTGEMNDDALWLVMNGNMLLSETEELSMQDLSDARRMYEGLSVAADGELNLMPSEVSSEQLTPIPCDVNKFGTACNTSPVVQVTLTSRVPLDLLRVLTLFDDEVTKLLLCEDHAHVLDTPEGHQLFDMEAIKLP